ncbi:FtsX-like permease family protein [Candidatus Lokiarchaeum ossiferum]|uniref:FtsX-like permease family protein n=1 Tax=Candidatus Lokiarchaeum ossiferum TaxID=2951803 RepID=UPI00352DC5E5
MNNRLKYYFKQGRKSIRKSALIVIGLGIALSMVSGIYLFTDSYKQETLQKSFGQIDDFNIFYRALDSNSTYDLESGKIENLISSFSESNKHIDIIDQYSFEIIQDYRRVAFFKNYSQIPTSQRPILNKYFSSQLQYNAYSTNFYESTRFNRYFEILNGTFPTSMNQILIDINFAQKMNLSIGKDQMIEICAYSSLYGGDDYQLTLPDEVHALNFSKFEVVGIYASKLARLKFSQDNYFFGYHFDELTQKISPVSEHSLEDPKINPPLFTFLNTSKNISSNPLEDVLARINVDFSIINFFPIRGCSLISERNSISFNFLSTITKNFGEAGIEISHALPDYMEFDNSLYFALDGFSTQLKDIRISLQLIVLPILIFAIFIGAFALKVEQKNRIEEFLLLKSKGASTKMLSIQLIIEGIFIGVSSSIFACFCGIGVFYSFRTTLLSLVSWNQNLINIPIFFSINSVLMTFLVGILITQVANVFSLVYLKNVSTKELLSRVNSESFDLTYDETTLFNKSKSKNVTLNDLPFFSGNMEDQNPYFLDDSEKSTNHSFESSRKLSGNKEKPLLIDRILKRQNLYKDTVSSKEKGAVRRFGLILILLSLFPLIFYLIVDRGRKGTNDTLIWISEIISPLNQPFAALSILSPILMVIGLIRFIAYEKPSRLGRLSKMICSIYSKGKSKLVALNIVKKKPYVMTMYLIGIFVSLLTFSNIYFQTSVRTEIIDNNLKIGADCKLYFPQIPISEEIGLDFSSKIRCAEDIDSMEDQLLNLTLTDNQNMSTKAVTAFVDSGSPAYFRVYHETTKYITNVSKYLDLISEPEKLEPEKNLYNRLRNLTLYNNNLTSGKLPGVIVNSQYQKAHLKSLYEKTSINHYYYDPLTNRMQLDEIVAIIFDVIDTLPGFYTSKSSSYYNEEEFMLIDLSSVNTNSSYLHSLQFFTLMNLNENCTLDQSGLSNKISEVTDNFNGHTYVSIYQDQWNDMALDIIQFSSGTYVIFYFEFIIIGILMAIGIGILLVYLRKMDKHYHGTLLARGVGKKGLLALTFMEIFVIFFIPIFNGIISGSIFGIVLSKIIKLVNFEGSSYRSPIFWNAIDLVGIIAIIPLLSFLIYLLLYYLESKRKYTDYFHQF